MNSLYNVRIPEFKPDSSLIATSEFFQKVAPEKSYATCKKVEALIEKFSLRLYECNVNGHDHEAHLLLRNDFEDLIAAIKSQYISSNYIGLFSWLIDRAFLITPKVAAQIGSLENHIEQEPVAAPESAVRREPEVAPEMLLGEPPDSLTRKIPGNPYEISLFCEFCIILA